MRNKKHLAVLISILIISTSLAGIYYYENENPLHVNAIKKINTGAKLNNVTNDQNGIYDIKLIPNMQDSEIADEITSYSISIYMETPKSIDIHFTDNPACNVEILNKTLYFHNSTVKLNGSILQNISLEWYNYFNTTCKNQIESYENGSNSLSMQVYAFADIGTYGKIYEYTYFNNIPYNPIKILSANYFNYSLNVNFYIDNYMCIP
jgi:hypothetical protein